MVKNELTKKIVCVIILIAIGCVSFFVAAPWAGDPANYEKTTETLDNLENKAIIMTGTAAALATAAALVPGDATTPIANKLADVAGYMVIVYVAIDNAKGATQYGGTLAAPLARKILLDCIDILNIKKQENGVLKRYNYLDIKYANVDNVIGLSLNDAIKRLKDFKVEIEGEGDKVIYQSPINTSISVGETVRIMLGK